MADAKLIQEWLRKADEDLAFAESIKTNQTLLFWPQLLIVCWERTTTIRVLTIHLIAAARPNFMKVAPLQCESIESVGRIKLIRKKCRPDPGCFFD
jgi:hypothetical protein